MASVEVEIAARKYSVACRDGEEAHLRSVAALVDSKAQEAAAARPAAAPAAAPDDRELSELRRAHMALRARVEGAIAQLDGLLATGEQG